MNGNARELAESFDLEKLTPDTCRDLRAGHRKKT